LPADEQVYLLCRFVLEEIQRLQDACIDLEQHDMASFGKKMFATHKGLSELFDVSCKELDFMVDFVKNEPAVLGARMMGGGFGGCSINLVKAEAIEALSGRIEAAYKAAFGIEMKVYIATIEEGTCIVDA
jgi:galactokinase